MMDWHDKRDSQWLESAPPFNARVRAHLAVRQNQIIDDYQPDLMYFDDTGLPLGQTGLEAAAYMYNRAIERRGDIDVVMFGKQLQGIQRRAIVEDVERGVLDEIRPDPWQTDTCIGGWHYIAAFTDDNATSRPSSSCKCYRDIVSKNGNFLLNIPVRGDGTIDEKEEASSTGSRRWTQRNGEAIFATRPWRKFGEGPTKPPPPGNFSEDKLKPFTAEDIRFTKKGETLYAIFLDWPQGESAIAVARKQCVAGRGDRAHRPARRSGARRFPAATPTRCCSRCRRRGSRRVRTGAPHQRARADVGSETQVPDRKQRQRRRSAAEARVPAAPF